MLEAPTAITLLCFTWVSASADLTLTLAAETGASLRIRKGEAPVGFVVFKEEKSAESRQIITFLRQQLASFKIPIKIVIRKSLPKNATGKILKYVLKEEIEKTLFQKTANTKSA